MPARQRAEHLYTLSVRLRPAGWFRRGRPTFRSPPAGGHGIGETMLLPIFRSASLRLIAGLVLGVAVGLAAPYAGFNTGVWLAPVGDGFVALLQLLMLPLIFTCIVAGAAGVAGAARLGSVTMKTLVYYFVTTGMAMILGLICANLVAPGEGLHLVAKAAAGPDGAAASVGLLAALSGGNLLWSVCCALLLAFVVSAAGDRLRPLARLCRLAGGLTVRATNIVMLCAPIGVFALTAHATAVHGTSAPSAFGRIVLAMYLACALHVVITYLPLIRLSTGMNLGTFARTVSAPVLTAFVTCSSTAALPANLEAARRLGASRAVTGYSLPIGNAINMDGTGIYMAVAAVFAASAYDVPLPLVKQLAVLLTGMLISVGAAGVPGGGLALAALLLEQAGLPPESLVLIAGMDRIMDMPATALNVLGDAVGAVTISRLEDEDGGPVKSDQTGAPGLGTECYEAENIS